MKKLNRIPAVLTAITVGFLVALGAGCAAGGGGGGGSGGRPVPPNQADGPGGDTEGSVDDGTGGNADDDAGDIVDDGPSDNVVDDGNDGREPADDPVDLVGCQSPGGQDAGVQFGPAGTTRVLLSTLGNGRHLGLFGGGFLLYELDQPVRFCAVIPEHFSMQDLTSGQKITINSSHLFHAHVFEEINGVNVVVRSRVSLFLPTELTAGHDYQLTLDARGLSLDGEFQMDPGTPTARNGFLPSGDGVPGGDFVQLFRAIGSSFYLSSTQGAAGMALDASDGLYVVGENGLFGPFKSPAVVTEGNRLAPELGTLVPGSVAVTNDGLVVVKQDSSGQHFAIDPANGQDKPIADGASFSSEEHMIIAPEGFQSVELSGADPGDIVIADFGITIPDLEDESGPKGGLRLFDPDLDKNLDAYVSLFVPPARPGRSGEIYGAYVPFDAAGFEIHRILPNGVVDRTVLTDHPILPGIRGTAALQLQDHLGREEFLMLGSIIPDAVQLSQILPEDVASGDLGALIVYDKSEHRTQILSALNISEFGPGVEPRSQLKLTSDLNRVYASLPLDSIVVAFDGFTNEEPAGDPPCQSDLDKDTDFSNPARLVTSTLGRGRHLLRGSPTTIAFTFDAPIPLCSVTNEKIKLFNVSTSAAVALADFELHRVPDVDRATGEAIGATIVIDLPDQLETGSRYRIELSAAGLGLSADVVQVFQLIEGSVFLSKSRGAVGITLDNNGGIFVANEDEIYGPFSEAAELRDGDRLNNIESVAGAGRAIVADQGKLLYPGQFSGTIHSIDPSSKLDTEIMESFGSSDEIGAVVLPSGFSNPGFGVEPGDLLLLRSDRALLLDFVAEDGVEFFSVDSVFNELYASVSISPLAPELVLAFNEIDFREIARATVRRMGSDGIPQNVFSPLEGLALYSAVRLEDEGGSQEYLLIGEFTAGKGTVTGQIRDQSFEGMELMVYNVKNNALQVVGFLSNDLILGRSAMAASPELDTVYITLPMANRVIRFDGLSSR